jgi:hypothetical protein
MIILAARLIVWAIIGAGNRSMIVMIDKRQGNLEQIIME